jgi:hypothetical protein
MNKVYLVMNVENGVGSMIEKAFTTLEKAEQYKLKLEDEFKDSIIFKHKSWWYEIEELEIF